MTTNDTIRMFAGDVGLNPTVNGADNVQDALAALTPIAFGPNTTVVSADAPVTVPFDNAQHDVSCITATPPAWMDNAGNITAPGLYLLTIGLAAGVAATVPGLYGTTVRAIGDQIISADALAAANADTLSLPIALAVADLPYSTRSSVTMPTDITGTLTAGAFVRQLVSS